MVAAVAATSDRGPVPAAVRRAAALVVAEGVALVVLCAAYAAEVLLGRPQNRGLALAGAAMGLVAGIVVVLLGRGLAGGRRAVAAPVLVAQLLALPVGIGLLQGHLPVYASAVLLPAAGVLALLFGTRGGRAMFGA